MRDYTCRVLTDELNMNKLKFFFVFFLVGLFFQPCCMAAEKCIPEVSTSGHSHANPSHPGTGHKGLPCPPCLSCQAYLCAEKAFLNNWTGGKRIQWNFSLVPDLFPVPSSEKTFFLVSSGTIPPELTPIDLNSLPLRI